MPPVGLSGLSPACPAGGRTQRSARVRERRRSTHPPAEAHPAPSRPRAAWAVFIAFLLNRVPVRPRPPTPCSAWVFLSPVGTSRAALGATAFSHLGLHGRSTAQPSRRRRAQVPQLPIPLGASLPKAAQEALQAVWGVRGSVVWAKGRKRLGTALSKFQAISVRQRMCGGSFAGGVLGGLDGGGFGFCKLRFVAGGRGITPSFHVALCLLPVLSWHVPPQL